MLKSGKNLDPKLFNLSSRMVIRELRDGNIVIIKDRKSRIIMKDGLQIVSQAKAIRKVFPNKQVVFSTTAQVCSKTKVFLNKNGITLPTP